jgi:hypothetical protein
VNRSMVFAATMASALAVLNIACAALASAKSSPNVVGQKYSDASSALTSAGFNPVVSTTVGDRLAWADCIVYNQRDRSVPPPANSSGSPTSQTLVSLNCDAPVASAKIPGRSLGSPEGRAAAAAAASKSASANG